jgi:hypothetical protein
MPNELTEAVRRLRQLQQDVDRLKSGGDDGEVRELRNTSEIVDTLDAAATGADALIDQTTRSSDTPATDVRQADGLEYGSAEYGRDGFS